MSGTQGGRDRASDGYTAAHTSLPSGHARGSLGHRLPPALILQIPNYSRLSLHKSHVSKTKHVMMKLGWLSSRIF